MAKGTFELFGGLIRLTIEVLDDHWDESSQLTKSDVLVLNLLDNCWPHEMRGNELVKASNGRLKLHSIYFLLLRLEEAGLVSRRVGPPPQTYPQMPDLEVHYFKLTEDGYRAWQAVVAERAAAGTEKSDA